MEEALCSEHRQTLAVAFDDDDDVVAAADAVDDVVDAADAIVGAANADANAVALPHDAAPELLQHHF